MSFLRGRIQVPLTTPWIEVGEELNVLDEALVGELGYPQQFGFAVDSVSLDVGVICCDRNGEVVKLVPVPHSLV